ncbi:alpha/beta hydrolase [Albimonas pacifica]|uniref:Acetyl esterase n=1 Tax=Albimonas pacifica TaxID=1114924 RepID=A0A1I3E1C1_9RHOB|nr:alpha/beta hydrolase [Albimonas pacifica]SFH92777.1 acetyl esterase [Albimonas pacifica]
MDGPAPLATPDYDWILEADTRAFVETSRRNSRVEGEPTAASRRAAYDANCRYWHNGRPEGVQVEDLSCEGPRGPIPLRRYVPASGPGSAFILYLHGGGFVVGGLDSHDDICAEMAHRTGYETVSVDYRMAPEFQHPAFFDDAFAAWEWAVAAAGGRPLVISGDSAGGTLAAAVVHASRGREGAPVGQVLIYPSLGGDPTRGSFVLHADAPLLSRADRAFYASQRDMSLVPDDDPRAWPLRDPDVSGLPMTVCINAQCDPLADDGKAYRDRILAVGGRAFSVEEPGLTHGFLRARHASRQAGLAFDRIVESLRALGAGERPKLS